MLAALEPIGLSRTAENTKRYASACRKEGENLGVAVIDLWSIVATKAGWKPGGIIPGAKSSPKSEVLQDLLSDGISQLPYLFCDAEVHLGLHFTSNGYKVLFSAIKEKIESTWPDESAGQLPPVFPPWPDAPK